MFQYVDALIAFMLLMLVGSLFITATTQVVIAFLGLRGANLRRSLADLLEAAYPDEEAKHWAKEIAGRVLRHPMMSSSIFSHFRWRAERLPLVPLETAGKLQGLSASIPLLPWITGAVGGFFVTPIAMAMAKGLFGADTCRYWDSLASYVPAIDLCNHPWRTGMIAGAILGGLISRWRLASSIRVEELPAVLEKLAEPLPGTLPDAAQRTMLRMAWSEKEPGNRARAGGAQAGEPAPSNPYFDESMINCGAKVSLQNQNLYSAAADFDEGIVRHAEPVEPEGIVVVEEENTAAQAKQHEPEPAIATGGLTTTSAPSERSLEGLRAWFDPMMERASQRFSAQARIITVALSCIFVFAWHFDAVRLLQTMSQGAELRAQLAATAAGIDKQAEQLPRSKQGGHTVVPEVYRQAMVSALRTASVETPANEESEAKSQARRRSRAKDREKAAAAIALVEDSITVGAKSKAMHELEIVPGFTSREDAEFWLRTTLEGNPASERLAAAYQQEVNTELASDSDRLMDESASLKSELARSQFKLFQDDRGSSGTPGLLVTIALLSLGAAFWYNTLRNLASLQPQMATREDGKR